MRKKICIALAFVFVLTLTGCAKSISLTNEEEDLIAEYSSFVLVKHSKQNSSLLLSRDDLKKAIERKEEQDRKVAERRAEREKYSGGSSTSSTSTSQTSSSSSSEGGNNSGGSNTGMIQPAESSVSMTDAVGVAGLQFDYKGYEVVGYIQGSAFSVNASIGKELVVMNFTCTNTKDETITCDLKTAKTKFKGYFNGKAISPLATAFLPNDIASFDKNTKIAAKDKFDCVLVFDVPKDLADSITDIKLQVSKDGSSTSSGVAIN